MPYVKAIIYFGQPCALACDGNCGKAWGINNRPRVQLSTDPDDYAFLADGELGDAPTDPGTYEGRDGKPQGRDYLNKWCARECERSAIADQWQLVELRDFSRRLYNLPSSEPVAAQPAARPDVDGGSK